MGKFQQWIAIAVVAVLGVLAAGWFLLVSPKRGDAADLRDQAAAEKASAARLESELAALKEQATRLPQQQARLAAIARRIPPNPSLPSLVRGLTTAAETAGVSLEEVAPTEPTSAADLVARSQGGTPGSATTAAPTAAAPTAAAPTAGTTTGTTSTTAATPSTTTPVATSGLTDLQVIPVSIVVRGGYYQVGQYLSNLEALQRSFLVAGFDLGPVGGETSSGSNPTGQLELKITGGVFLSIPTTTTSTPAAGAAAPAK